MSELTPQTTEQSCGWTRLTDSQDPFETRPIRYRRGCDGTVARARFPVYPDVCPHCQEAVKVESRS